ncbi:protein-disulfide isomerase [Bradyrhizobium sp. USDA 4341]
MTVQNIDAVAPGPVRITKTNLAVAGALIVTVSICAVVLGFSIRHYIETAVSDAVDIRARAIATDVIKTNPELVADALNRFVKTQQDEAARKEEEEHRVNWTEMSRADDAIPVLGDADAKVTVVYFYDSACPYCKQMDPLLRPLTVSGTGVKVVYREIPILGDASKRAARFGAALWKLSPSDYDSFHGALLAYRGQLNDAVIDRIATETLGPDLALKVASAATADKDGKISALIQRELDLAKKVGIHGTPFFAIGGQTFFDGATSRDKFMAAIEKAKRAK